MADVTLSKTEQTILIEAAGREGGLLAFPEAMKDLTRQRMLAKFEGKGLVAASGDDAPVLTREGYRAAGLRPPRRKTVKTEPIAAQPEAAPEKPRTKQALVIALLSREAGASLAELTAATGWLPHTTRASLSRLRSAGHALSKRSREDGTTAYRLLAAEVEVVERAGTAEAA